MRYFEAAVAQVYYFLLYSVYLIAQYNGIFLFWRDDISMCERKHCRTFALLYSKHGVSFGLQTANSFAGIFGVLPAYAFFCAQRGLVYFVLWRCGCNAAQHYAFCPESIAGAEHRTYVMHRAYVVEHYH